MAVNPADASSAYLRAAQQINNSAEGAGEESQQSLPGQSFAGMVRDNLEQAADLSRQAEAVSKQAIAGNASKVEVVTAVNNAETALRTVTSVRDKMVSAYKSIIKMPV
mgnify:CR=1 FL=1